MNEEEPEIDPRGDADAESEEDTIEDYMDTSGLGRRALRLVCWHGSSEHTAASTADESANNQLSQTEGRRHENRADQSNYGAEEDGLSSTELVTDIDTGESTKHVTKREEACHSALHERIMRPLGSSFQTTGPCRGELCVEILLSSQTSQDSESITDGQERREDDEQDLQSVQCLASERHADAVTRVNDMRLDTLILDRRQSKAGATV